MFHSERFVGPEMDVVTWSERGHLGQYVGDEARRRRVVGSIDTICIGPAVASGSEVALPSSGYAAKTAAQ
ncbi:MAG: hypothetical protein R2689_06060 [Microthrixaceae bacterium]|nr:hypothetical protein [Microthrixaceae bacterium]